MSSPESSAAATAQEAMDVFINLHVVFKLAKVYDPNNSQFQERMQVLVSSMERISGGGEVQVRIQDGRVFINRIRLKFNVANYPLYQFMRREFSLRQLGMLALLPGLSIVEFQRFVAFLSKSEIGKTDPFERLAEDFQAAAFPHIRLEKVRVYGRSEAGDSKAVPMYFLGIYHLKDIFDAREGVLNLHVTKRYIQTICNLLALDESVLFGMTNVKNFEEYTLNHSVNVCVLSLALGRRLGLSRPDLINLGLGSCLHDVGKFEIPAEVLDKPGKLDAAERATIEKHPHRGAVRLIQTRANQQIPLSAIMVALEHHITPKFEGYPKYAWRYKISLFSRIVKVVDYYDAITTKRVYRPKTFTPGEAVKLMLERGAADATEGQADHRRQGAEDGRGRRRSGGEGRGRPALSSIDPDALGRGKIRPQSLGLPAGRQPPGRRGGSGPVSRVRLRTGRLSPDVRKMVGGAPFDSENLLLDPEGPGHGPDLVGGQAFALAPVRQVGPLVAGRRLGVFDAVHGPLDGLVRAGHRAVLAPDGDAVSAQGFDRGGHKGVGSGNQEGHTAQPLGQVDDGFGLPAQEAAVEKGLVPVGGNMAQKGQRKRLGVDYGVEVRAGGADLVPVDGQVRVEFAGQAVEQSPRRGE